MGIVNKTIGGVGFLGKYIGGLMPIGGGAPRAMDYPTITGTQSTFQTLTAVAPPWFLGPPDSLTYRWFRAEPIMDGAFVVALTNPQVIDGAIASTYNTVLADYFAVILVEITGIFGTVLVVTTSLGVGPIEYTDLYGGTGTFDAATGFNLSSGDVTISTGKLRFAAGVATKNVLRPVGTQGEGTYRIRGFADSISGGQITVRVTGGNGGARTGTNTAVTGFFELDIVNGPGVTFANIGIQAAAACAAVIDNVTAYRIL